MIVNTDTLTKYAQEGYNVLMSGRHGVGKTAIIKKVFDEVFGPINVSWKYFSASTMDPWVDFIGVPKNFTREDGVEVLRIIPPEYLTGEEKIEALFFDEINRADEKTLNAIMELIQFKSINGRKFPNLKCIWAAENPADDRVHNYMVKELDPAQRDRFNVQIRIPYVLDADYMTNKFGKTVYDVGSNWWEGKENRKNTVSPRKLDDILTAHIKGFDVTDFTTECDLSELKVSLNNIAAFDNIVAISKSTDRDLIKKTFTLDKIRENQVSFETFDPSYQVFNRIYKHLGEEVQNFINRTFSFVYKEDGNGGLTNEQMEVINKFMAEPRPEYSFANVDIIKDRIHDVVTNFTVQDIFGGSLSPYDMINLFPFTFDPDEFKEEQKKKDLADALCSNSEDKAKFRDFFRVVSAMSIQYATKRSSEQVAETNFYKFFKNLDKSDSLSNTVYNISVVTKHRIVSQIETGNMQEAKRMYNDEDIFYDK